MYSAIILAGGSGSRMKQSIPKQFLALAGKPIILHTLERLEKIDAIDEVVIVCHPQYKEMLNFYIESYMLKKKYLVVDGGETRQKSAYNGLIAASNENVIIHEAARPFVTAQEFQALIDDEAENAFYGIEIPFTVLMRDQDHISGLLNRDQLVNVQLPQKFNKATILAAHELAAKEGLVFTEDASMVHYIGKPVKVLEGTVNNIKITNAIDLLLGETIYKEYIVGRN